jgi:hypothetical protein
MAPSSRLNLSGSLQMTRSGKTAYSAKAPRRLPFPFQAHIAVALATKIAVPTVDERVNGNPVTRFKLLDLAADLGHHCRHFVSQHGWQLQRCVGGGPLIPIIYFGLANTDSAVLNLKLHFVGLLNFGFGYI